MLSFRYKTAMHECEVCKKEFKGKSSLEMHFRTHSGESARAFSFLMFICIHVHLYLSSSPNKDIFLFIVNPHQNKSFRENQKYTCILYRYKYISLFLSLFTCISKLYKWLMKFIFYVLQTFYFIIIFDRVLAVNEVCISRPTLCLFVRFLASVCEQKVSAQ